jgi:hypothetical protein
VRITLQSSASRSFPNCSDTGRFDPLEAAVGSFRFPKTPGVQASSRVRDDDYVARTYFAKTKHGRKWITHGSGFAWSFGIPSDFDVWPSVSYEEITLSNSNFTVMDARG